MVKKAGEGEAPPADPQAEERKRLKSLAFSRKLLSRTPAKPLASLEPSKTVLKHQGRDVVKKGQRKNKFLFSFPGLLAPLSGGKIGELANLNTRNPVLYLEFPQGRMKLFGTVIYPKNKYLTLQFSKSSKGVLCEDSFENMIVFSEAWWIGSKEENPEEIQLAFPEEYKENNSDFDFRGGAGAAVGEKSVINKQAKELAEHLSPDTELMDEISDDSGPVTENNVKKMMEETPVRHSARTAGKSLNYAEHSSGDDSNIGVADESEMLEDVCDTIGGVTKSSKLSKDEDSNVERSCSNKESEEVKGQSTGMVIQQHMDTSEEKSLGKRGTLVQATLSTLFDKVAKKSKCITDNYPVLKDSNSKRPPRSSKQQSKVVKAKVPGSKKIGTGRRKAGAASIGKQKPSKVQDDEDIEDISSESQELEESDEDWTS